MNEIEKIIKIVEMQMKAKGLKKGDMGKDLGMSPVTIAAIFNSYKGNLDTLKKILEYVENK
ncbi:MAG: helix-turn-helix domain-containing protein [Fusobacteriaceae bacterium]